MIRKIAGILIFSLCCIAMSGQTAKAHIKAGEQFLLNGIYDAALAEFNQALLLDPNDGKIYYFLATVMLVKADTLKASEYFQKAAVMAYLPEENFLNAAKFYYSVQKKNEALKNIELGLGIRPKYFELLLLKTKILFESGDYNASLISAIETLKSKELAIVYYYLGTSAYRTGDIAQAEKALEQAIIRDKNLTGAYTELAKLQIDKGKYDYAVDNCSMVLLLIEPNNIDALEIRSRAFRALNEPQQAIDDITKVIALDKNNWNYYFLRGNYNYDFAFYSNAVDDLTVALTLNDTLSTALLKRAQALELLGKKIESKQDYVSLLAIFEKKNVQGDSRKLVEDKIFELGRETNKPLIEFIQPQISDKSEFKVKETDTVVVIKGNIRDESGIKDSKLNNMPLKITKNSEGVFEFYMQINTSDLDFVTLTAVDKYDNIASISYPVIFIETEAPQIRLISPAPEGSNIIHLETGDNSLYIEGKIEDASNITSIKVDELNASFAPGDYNPRFTATIDIKNRKNITLTVIDKFGNKTEQTYEFARDGYMLSGNNPMGKTWVVIIENSEYKEFGGLSNTEKDVTGLKEALSRYKISKVLHMKNMSKREMERFFAIDLRDLIVSNNVNSLMIWYAGHGKFKNNTGYWVPIDGRYNDEYSFYNVNALKASVYSYSSLTHLLIVSDACAAGESFSIAMRGDNSLANCDDANLVTQKSALVLASTESEVALDNSLFAQSFINALSNNPADCIPIDAIAERITLTMQKNTVQKPVFGRISGLENNNGTFFFITK